MRFLRYFAGCNRRNDVSNLAICNELQIFNINDKIKGKGNEWCAHIQPMDPYRITRKADEY